MQSSELWAAWIVAALMIGLVAWVGHIEARDSSLTPASEVARRSPASMMTPAIGDPDEVAATRGLGPSTPSHRRLAPAPGGQPHVSTGGPPRVNLCVIDGPRQGVC
jgi:hypothetical protein